MWIFRFLIYEKVDFCFCFLYIIGERWKIDHLIGNSEEEVDVYELSEMPKGKSAGYYVEFKNNNTFHSSYYAPCGNDCFTSTT